MSDMTTRKYPVLVVETDTDRRRALKESLLEIPDIELYATDTVSKATHRLVEREYDAMVINLQMVEISRGESYNSLVWVRKFRPGMIIIGIDYGGYWPGYHPSTDIIIERGDLAALTKTLKNLLVE